MGDFNCSLVSAVIGTLGHSTRYERINGDFSESMITGEFLITVDTETFDCLRKHLPGKCFVWTDESFKPRPIEDVIGDDLSALKTLWEKHAIKITHALMRISVENLKTAIKSAKACKDDKFKPWSDLFTKQIKAAREVSMRTGSLIDAYLE